MVIFVIIVCIVFFSFAFKLDLFFDRKPVNAFRVGRSSSDIDKSASFFAEASLPDLGILIAEATMEEGLNC